MILTKKGQNPLAKVVRDVTFGFLFTFLLTAVFMGDFDRNFRTIFAV